MPRSFCFLAGCLCTLFILGGTPISARPPKPITQLTAMGGLAGGGSGPRASIGIARSGVTTTHVRDGALIIDDFSLAAREALRGERGPEGPSGPQGPPGPEGDPGPAGPQGERGPSGERGPQGDRGPDGVPGPRGETGPAGPTGAQGERGVQGPEGPVGPPGERGPVGPQGDRGPQGQPGEGAISDGPGAGGVTFEYGRVGAPAPGGGVFFNPGVEFASATNRRGQLCFRSSLLLDGERHADALFFVRETGAQVCVVRSGDLMPDGSIANGLSDEVVLTDTGTVYFVANDGGSSGVFGWNGVSLFTVLPQGSTTADGKLIAGVRQLRLQPPRGLAFVATLYESVSPNRVLGPTRFLYRTP
jgi:hypothetical protein